MKLRRLPIRERRSRLKATVGSPDWLARPDTARRHLDWAEQMVENAVGVLALPLGLAPGIVVDGVPLSIPMATEEPSVIAAASFAAAIVARCGGFVTDATPPCALFHIFWEDPTGERRVLLEAQRARIEALIAGELASLSARGGGLRTLSIASLPAVGTLKLQASVDVRDAQGANRLNTCAEAVGRRLRADLGVAPLMAIVSNSGAQRRSQATCRLSLHRISQLCRGVHDPETSADRLVRAAALAQHDPDRAVTHNKGIMNGITALALATGNDTRALEAAVHAWAARDGRYRGLSQIERTAEGIEARIDLPTPLATVGGGTETHPSAGFARRILGEPDAPRLGRIAAALGLAQNLAALAALVGPGIQAGHMPLHHRRGPLHAAPH